MIQTLQVTLPNPFGVRHLCVKHILFPELLPYGAYLSQALTPCPQGHIVSVDGIDGNGVFSPKEVTVTCANRPKEYINKF